MGADRMSENAVGPLRAEIDERVNALRQLPERARPDLWRDATSKSVREGGRTVGRAAMAAVAVNGGGRREIPGVQAGHREAGAFWTDVRRIPADRDLRGVKLVTADDHKARRAAARRVFNGTHQRCHVHRFRNALGHAPARLPIAVAAMLGRIFARGTRAEAEGKRDAVAEALRGRTSGPAP